MLFSFTNSTIYRRPKKTFHFGMRQIPDHRKGSEIAYYSHPKFYKNIRNRVVLCYLITYLQFTMYYILPLETISLTDPQRASVHGNDIATSQGHLHLLITPCTGVVTF